LLQENWRRPIKASRKLHLCPNNYLASLQPSSNPTALIEVIQKPLVRKADKPDVVMSRMDYAIICRVIVLLNERGMTDDELSFLLGKANNCVFGFIVKPGNKNRFTED